MLIELSPFYSKLFDGAIYFHGPDAAKFLQGQITCDVNKVKDTHSTLGARCNLQGRVVSLFRLVKWQDGLLMLLPKNMVQLTIDSLKKYAVFFKVTIEDYSEQVSIYAIWNEKKVDKLFIENIACFTAFQTENHSATLLIAMPSQADTVEEQLNQLCSKQAESYWHACKVMQLIPDIVPETSEKYLPHELNLPELGAISFDKGCYLGQEIVARMEYRGQVKQHLHLIEAEVIPELTLNEHITDETGKNVGSLVDYVMIENRLFGLALIRNSLSTTKLALQNATVSLVAE